MTYTELDIHENDSQLPRVHAFTKDLTNWLSLAAIGMFIIYSILYIVYEVVLDLTHVRWIFTAFLVCCAVDVVSFWICRYAVSDASGKETCLIWLVLIVQSLTGLFYLIAPILIVCTYRFIPEVSMKAGKKILAENEEKYAHTLEDYVDPDPCNEQEESGNKREPSWQCGYVKSIKTAAYCMWISMVPKILVYYLLLRIVNRAR